MGFLAELKRRNVFRVGIAYLVLGWVVVQVTDTVSSALSLPEWTLSLVIWLGVIGFPFALLFAWAFELTAEGLKREHEVDRSQSITHHTGRKVDFAIIGLLLFAVVFLVVDRYTGQVTPVTEPLAIAVVPIEVTPEAAQTKVYDSIAVLPFTNMSNDPEQEFFGDGISEDIITALSKISALMVIARNSTFIYKGKAVDIKQVGREQGVRYVLEGSVRKAGNRMRITAQLIDAATGHHLWAEHYDRDLEDIFALQDEITQKVVVALEVQLVAGEQARLFSGGTDNLEAWECARRGWGLLGAYRAEDLPEVKRLLQRAIDLDP